MAEVEHKIRIVTELEDKASAPIKEAKAKILDFSEAAEKAGRKVRQSMDSQQVSAKGLAGAIVGLQAKYLAVAAATATVTAAIAKAVSEATQFEATVNRLATNLGLVGIKSTAFIQSLQAQASAFQETTKFSDDAVLSVQSMLLAFGVAPSKLKEATQAVVDFSAATGRSLESVADDVGRTFSGFSGTLGKLIPEIASLTEEQLRSGRAVEILADRFAGAATRDAKTFAGAMSQLNNAWKDFLKSIGEFIIGIPAIKSGVRLLTDAFNALKNSISPDKGSTDIEKRLFDLRSLAEQLEQIARPGQSAGSPAQIAFEKLKEVNEEIRRLFKEQNSEKEKTQKLIEDELRASDEAIRKNNAKLKAIEDEKKLRE